MIIVAESGWFQMWSGEAIEIQEQRKQIEINRQATKAFEKKEILKIQYVSLLATDAWRALCFVALMIKCVFTGPQRSVRKRGC